MAPSAQKRIVLTGGPGAGKTVVSMAIARAEPARFVVVPEAATQVYGALGTRWDRLTVPQRRDVQRHIYRLQLEQEARLAVAHPDKVLLLDRGTVDGAAYWPEGAEDYWRELGTTMDAELVRYDAVIWMETCAALDGAYDGPASNACRHEDAAMAVRNGEALLRLWTPHPALRRICAFACVDEKIEAVRKLLT